jgi:hypothetical protein
LFGVAAFGVMGATIASKNTVPGGWAAFTVLFIIMIILLVVGGLIYGNVITIPDSEAGILNGLNNMFPGAGNMSPGAGNVFPGGQLPNLQSLQNLPARVSGMLPEL